MKITVTRENIMRGREVGTLADPISVALSEHDIDFPLVDDEFISYESRVYGCQWDGLRMHWYKPTDRVRINTPRKVRWFIWWYRRGWRNWIPSFSFELNNETAC